MKNCNIDDEGRKGKTMDAALSIERLEYEQLTGEIKRAMRRSARDAVQLGFMLRRVMDDRIWEVEHSCFDDYLREELHMEYSLASRFMAINKRYSVSGKSMDISPEYTEYSQGVLIEMLNMPPELEEKVTPEMTVREVREIKRQAKQKKEKPVAKQEETEAVIDGEYREVSQEQKEEVATSQEKLSAYGFPVTEYPEGSLIAIEGCGHKHHCFSCAQDCGIRQKDRYCGGAPLGNPFPCTTMNVLGQLKEEMGDACQFINQEKAYHRLGDNGAVPCCKECGEICGYRCRRSVEQLETEEQEETVQPELPALKNTDQRKEWLKNYKAWGLWYRDENIDVNYYKYDFRDGSRLVVAEYPQRQDYWHEDAEDEYFFHLLEKGKKGYGKIRYDEKYRHTADSETYLVEFLKNIQKKGQKKR